MWTIICSIRKNLACNLQKNSTALFKEDFLPAANVLDQKCRSAHKKHWAPKWKKLRSQKVVRIQLPKFNEKQEDLSKDEIKSRLKEKGILPPRPWVERSFTITGTGTIFEPYVPPEGDGKRSVITTTGARQGLEFLQKKSKSMLAVRKIRNYEEDFSPVQFSNAAQDIYLNAHQAMIAKDTYKLQELVTERAYSDMTYNIKDKTIHWEFLKSLEPPRVVHARCTDVLSKENFFAQVTVRFHTQQKLAIYDRFGRLMHGSEIIAKDVLEYVVFEKNISNEYGVWRLHDKIIPDWMPPKEPTKITYRIVEDVQPDVVAVQQNDEETLLTEQKKENTSKIVATN